MKLRLLALSLPGIAVAAFAACSSPGGEKLQTQSQRISGNCYDPTHLVVGEALRRCVLNTPAEELEGYVQAGAEADGYYQWATADQSQQGFQSFMLLPGPNMANTVQWIGTLQLSSSSPAFIGHGLMTVTGVQTATCPGLPGALDTVAFSQDVLQDGGTPGPNATLLFQPNFSDTSSMLKIGPDCDHLVPFYTTAPAGTGGGF
jgi:hypothetical protein